jgi:SagB-type dehydrogenase family enzyme
MSREPRDVVATHAGSAFAEARAVRPILAASTRKTHTNDNAGPTLLSSGRLAVPITDVGSTRPFAEVVANRRSDRHLHPPSLTEVGTVLARAGLTRERGTDRAGAPVAHRAAPSAGARHPLTLVLLAADVRGLDPGSWILDPDAAVLRPGTQSPEQTNQALHEIGQAIGRPGRPPAAVLAVAQPDRTLSRYPLGISLLWRETGALLMLVHLAASDIGLGSCIVGTCGALHPDDGSGTGPVDLGAVALGAKAHAQPGAGKERKQGS